MNISYICDNAYGLLYGMCSSGHRDSHYCDAIMGTIASQITSLTIVYTTFYSDADQSKHQSSASLAFVWGIHRDRWIPRTKGQLRGKCFHLMTSSCVQLETILIATLKPIILRSMCILNLNLCTFHHITNDLLRLFPGLSRWLPCINILLYG